MCYIYDAPYTFKVLIDSEVGISIFKELTVNKFEQRSPRNVRVQGITEQKINISDSIVIPFDSGNHHKVFIYNLNTEFDEILGLDFLTHYNPSEI